VSGRSAPAATHDEAWTATFADHDARLSLVPADPDAHDTLVRSWGHEPHVTPWWRLDEPLDVVQRYLAQQRALGHLVPWIASADDRPFAYVETYVAAADPLADHYDAHPGDRGWHLFVGPPDAVGTGLARLLGRAVLARFFSEPGVERVVCEPDVRNARMLRYCAHLGLEPVAELDLPDKRAALLVCPRERFAARFPDDLARAAAARTSRRDP